MVTEDLTVGGGHTVHYTDHVSSESTLETYAVLVTNVTLIKIIKILLMI